MNNKGAVLVEIVASMLILAITSLVMTAAITAVTSPKMRSSGGSSLELQALNFARQTIENLRLKVSPNTGGGGLGAALLDTSYTSPCRTAQGTACGNGTTYTETLPADSDLVTKGGGIQGTRRVYKVWDISGGNNTVAYKKVTVTVQWID